MESGVAAKMPEAGHVDSGARDAGSPTKSGSVIVVSHAAPAANVFSNFVSAGFFDGPGNGYREGCRREITGSCSVLECDFTDGGTGTPAPGAPESAGAITIGGTTPPLILDYDPADATYSTTPAVPSAQLLFTGGDVLTFTARGDAVPSFTDSLVAPTPLAVTAPALVGGALSIDSSRDLVFEWRGSSAGKLSFNVGSNTSVSGTVLLSTLVSCQFSASAASGTIPTALLRRLEKTDATTTATLSTDLSNTKEVVAGDYDVHLAVGSAATTSDGVTPYATAKVTIF